MGGHYTLAQSFVDMPNRLPKIVELYSTMSDVRIPLFPKEVKIVWTKNPSRAFLVKSTYNVLMKYNRDPNC